MTVPNTTKGEFRFANTPASKPIRLPSIDDVVDAIERLKADGRYKRNPTLVESDAPLAFKKMEISATIAALEWVAGLRTTWWSEE